MGRNSLIGWTDDTHAFFEGCEKVSAGCKYCYAERMFRRFGKEFTKVRRIKNFDKLVKWTEPRKIFLCPTSDFFIKQADPWRAEAWDVMRRAPQHAYQIVTKRIERAMDGFPEDWGDGWPNVWLLVSAEDQEQWDKRVLQLLQTPAAVRGVSIEPLLSDIDTDRPILFTDEHGQRKHVYPLSGMVYDYPGGTVGKPGPKIDWLVIGGESGNDTGKSKYRPCHIPWMERIVTAGRQNGVAVFVKQMGTDISKRLALSARHGDDVSEFPKYLQVQQFPVTDKSAA